MNNRYWTEDLIGVLAEDEEDVSYNNQSIFINNQESVQFQVKLISNPPDSFPNVKKLTCFATYLEQWGFEDNPMLSDEERKQGLRDFLSESLIVFNAERKLLYNHQEVYNAKNIRLISKNDSYTNDLTLMPLPIYSEDKHGLNYYEFKQKLMERKYVGRIENMSNEPDDTPTYVIWKDDDEQYILFGEFDKHQYAHGGFCFSVRGELKEMNFGPSWLDDSYVNQKNIPDLMFVPLETIKLMTEAMEHADICIPDSNNDEPEQMESSQIHVENNVEDDTTHSGLEENMENDSIPLETDSHSDNDTGPTTSLTLQQDDLSNEDKFLEHFVATTQELGLSYSLKDLINFHTAMKSSNLVLLAGMSGTGKSKLVNAYRRALGLDSEQFTFISVRPSWTDDADLIGYADTLNMVYRPGDSGLVNVLKQAEKEEDKLFIICFDEMNLARVEHYFSQFLSILEMEPGQRQLRLYNDELANRLYNSAQYPPSITIKKNVMFVGTVNLDESTHHFSDKVLDRANVIELDVLNFDLLMDVGDKKKILHSRDRFYELYDSFININDFLELSEEERTFLWELHNELQKVNKQIGVGPRIVKQIDKYLKNLPITLAFTRSEAFDLQIVQRILTKIRGSEDQLQFLIGNYDKTNHEVSKSTFLELLDQYEMISDFKKTREIITQKARELKLNGYTI